jgi:hypothetical protein
LFLLLDERVDEPQLDSDKEQDNLKRQEYDAERMLKLHGYLPIGICLDQCNDTECYRYTQSQHDQQHSADLLAIFTAPINKLVFCFEGHANGLPARLALELVDIACNFN